LRKLSLAGHLPHVRDLSPLYALPLEELDVGSDVVVRSNVLGLRTMPTLRTLDGRSAAEYLRLLAEPDRVTAEEALRLGGKVTVRAADETEARTVESIDTLPERVRTLDAVDLSYTQVVDDDLAGLRPAAGLKALSLDSADRIGDAGLAHLAGLPLRSLDLRNTQVSDAGLPELLQLPDLAELSLQHTAVTDAGMAIVRQLPRLRNLTLSNNRVGDAGVAQLRGMTSLHILSIYDTQLTDAGLAHVATLVNLEDLSLSSTAVTDAGLKLLLPLQQLHHLFLERTAISDVGLAHLATLSNLRVLFLRETGIGNTGLTHLETAPVLQELFLERTRVTEEGILQLHSARPLIRIHWDGGVIEPESAEAAP
jgi:Leucine-rich repeat (LRR) protein